MLQFSILAILIVVGGYALVQIDKPKTVVLSSPGAVIFQPAPSTGSNTFLGSITGAPGDYWNLVTNANLIPANMIVSK